MNLEAINCPGYLRLTLLTLRQTQKKLAVDARSMLLRLRSGTPLRRLAITPLSQPDVLSAVGRRNYGRTITLSTFRHSSSAVRFSIPTYHSYNATSKLCNTQKYSTSSASLLPPAPPSKRSKALRILTVLVGTSIVLFITSQYHEPTRHLILAVQRCQRIGVAVLLSVVDYKRHFARKYANEEEEYEGLRQCHLRSARRILEVLKRNGGIYIKLVCSPFLFFLGLETTG
jgi:hypothetical protein